MKHVKKFSENLNEAKRTRLLSTSVPHRGRRDILNTELKEIKTIKDDDGTDIIHLIFEGGVLLIFGNDIESSIISKEYYDINYKN